MYRPRDDDCFIWMQFGWAEWTQWSHCPAYCCFKQKRGAYQTAPLSWCKPKCNKQSRRYSSPSCCSHEKVRSLSFIWCLNATFYSNDLYRSLEICGARRCQQTKSGCLSWCSSEERRSTSNLLKTYSSPSVTEEREKRPVAPLSPTPLDDSEEPTTCMRQKEFRENFVQDREHAVYWSIKLNLSIILANIRSNDRTPREDVRRRYKQGATYKHSLPRWWWDTRPCYYTGTLFMF